ncbi:MAG TPA: M36 family metallopeptidase [Kofleriaceae bacterium]|nr:M36 family metallopeptidase [Kofleriaceae bacterium]
MLFAACATPSGSPTPPGDPDDPGSPDGGGKGRPVTPTEQLAVSLGVSIMSSDANGAPRLMRAWKPRASALAAAPEAAARDHVAALAPLWVQQATPMALANNGVQRLRNGATFVKLAQQVDGVLVDEGELRVLMHPDGALAAVSGTLLPAMPAPAFVSSPSEALEHALDQLYGAQRARPAIAEAGDEAGWAKLEVAADPQVKVSEARARQLLARDGNGFVASYEVELFADAPPDPLTDSAIPNPAARRYVVRDAGGAILGETDLTQHDAFVYRVYAETTGNRRPLDGPLTDFSPHPTGFPDGSAPAGTVPSNLVVMEAFNETFDKWLPDNATTTSGNNSDAFSDLDGSQTFTAGDVRPEVRASRVLNYHYDTTLEPLATPDQIKAGVVNLFFINNWMHDWWYDSGFTEATGNAQLDNYGRGGVANDPITTLAQAGALAGARDNATMATPADGGRPRMRIFLFTTSTNTALNGPAGAIRSEGVSAPPHTFDLTGVVAIGADPVEPTNDACQPLTSDLTGKIALITFSGVCGSAVTVNNTRAAGAIGVILADGANDDPRGFAGSAAANIPQLAIGRTDGEALAAAVAAGPVTVTMHSAPFGVERDGDLDSGVSGHEWAHYLHHRLAVCTNGQQCGGMSEGWGDFNGLLLQLREGDNRDSTYAQGSYADADGTPNAGYFSIRRFPYSRDHAKNPLTFKHIADENPIPTTAPGRPNGGPNSEVHNTGEIWALMMFEAFNVLIDDHGTAIARRRITDYSVAGLLLTPPQATILEGRDAILAAASALDSDDMLLMAAAFAGRGAGSCAVGPTNAVRTNNGVIESGTLAAKLAAGNTSLADDVGATDHDGVLEPGESGTLRVTVANGGAVAAEEMVVTATSSNTGITLGAPIRIPLLQPFSSVDLTIPVRLAPTAPPNTSLTITISVVAQQTCDRNGITVVVTTPAGATAHASSAATQSSSPADLASFGQSRIVSSYQRPATSLRAADAAVCIMNDTP